MMLEEIFEHEHEVAIARNPARRVVRVQEPAEKAGFYLVRPDALAGLVVKKQVDPQDLLAKVTDAEASTANWVVDHVHCWCERCADARRMSQTHCD